MGFVVKVRRLKLQCIATAWAPAGFFFPGVGKLRVWRRKSAIRVQGCRVVGGLVAKPPEADEKL